MIYILKIKRINADTFVWINEYHCFAQYVLISNTPKNARSIRYAMLLNTNGHIVLSFYTNA